MAGLRLTEFDFIDVTVNSNFPMGRSGFKTISFDARCKRVTPEELDDIRESGLAGDRGALAEFCERILVSTAGLKDFKGNSCDVVPRDTDDVPAVVDIDSEAFVTVNKGHRDTKADFMATWPLPVDVVTAFIQAQVPKTPVKGSPLRKGFTKN